MENNILAINKLNKIKSTMILTMNEIEETNSNMKYVDFKDLFFYVCNSIDEVIEDMQ